ncbi:MAG: aldo/keto reductase [Pirellulales bacterium]|nr:aldo/keto reductase [Pirellulales bacterium]
MPDQSSSPVSRRQFIHRMAAASAAAATAPALQGVSASARQQPQAVQAQIEKTRSYNPQMEYRRLGKTGLWISAVSMGGHWKRVDKIIRSTNAFAGCETMGEVNASDMTAFTQNRADVVSACIDHGINSIDFAGALEPVAYGQALKGRREKMYIHWSMGAQELRHQDHRKAEILVDLLEKGLKDTGLQYADCWRLMAYERGGMHTQQEVGEMVKALEIARKKGLCRFTGFSTHDRKWAKTLIETYPDVMHMCCFPYTAKSKQLPEDSFLDALVKLDVGAFGIKPFASNAIFQGDGSPDGPHAEADNRIARQTIRYILTNPAITAPIPGLASVQQVENMVLAIRERREQDLAQADEQSPAGRLARSAQAELEAAAESMWTRLEPHHQFLKDWEYV